MENMEKTQVAREGEIESKTVPTSPELVEEVIKDTSLKEGLEKENKKEVEEKTKSLREKILSMLGGEKDPAKVKEKKMAKLNEDISALSKIFTADAGRGGLGNFSFSPKYESFIKEYGIENDKINETAKNLSSLKEELDNTARGPEKVEKQREFNERHRLLLAELRREAVSKIEAQ